MSKKTATKQDVRAFLRAVDELNALAERGLHIYLANDTLCLMSGPSHTRTAHLPGQRHPVSDVWPVARCAVSSAARKRHHVGDRLGRERR